MNVKIADILDERRVVVQVENNEFIAEWGGDKPEINESYAVEMDIDDELIWKANTYFSSENGNLIIQKDEGIKIVAKLDYNSEDNLATLKVYDSIVLIDIEEIEQDILNEWVEINCDSIRLSNINL
ncbi:hypothetical protein SAMN05444401_3299 [Clostridium amylolyticum]|uniref:Uncharacterized protein n=1 Tax=Clostridium amylolyticum TaxID=1121298 RepID=A0A1M6KBM1_9CLOT|nr:hypothetical protein [Clostridium amylolyticum]SHJ56310.1 hypothetical protein SAMN05444401_3299 [Clostridium amylolyticum]